MEAISVVLSSVNQCQFCCVLTTRNPSDIWYLRNVPLTSTELLKVTYNIIIKQRHKIYNYRISELTLWSSIIFIFNFISFKVQRSNTLNPTDSARYTCYMILWIAFWNGVLWILVEMLLFFMYLPQVKK